MSLRHPLLERAGIAHAFGTRDAEPPPRVLRPRQVHGTEVAEASDGDVLPADADAVWTAEDGVTVGVVTADCVPVLVGTPGGAHVMAIHAGWRGLAAGVVESALAALRAAGAEPGALVAAIGPCAGLCCYEVDEPVLSALRARFPAELAAALAPTRPGHARVDLAALVAAELGRTLEAERVGRLADVCTLCDAERFHSYRRDGPRAGRLLHWVTCPGSSSLRG